MPDTFTYFHPSLCTFSALPFKTLERYSVIVATGIVQDDFDYVKFSKRLNSRGNRGIYNEALLDYVGTKLLGSASDQNAWQETAKADNWWRSNQFCSEANRIKLLII
jgi:hypothetical protein